MIVSLRINGSFRAGDEKLPIFKLSCSVYRELCEVEVKCRILTERLQFRHCDQELKVRLEEFPHFIATASFDYNLCCAVVCHLCEGLAHTQRTFAKVHLLVATL